VAQFKDANGKPWSISLDAPTIRKVRNELDGLDLADGDGAALDRMAADPCLLVDCLWLLCQEQAEKAGVQPEQFARGLIGDAIDSATAAMLESIADFFPTQRRTLLRAIRDKNAKLRELGVMKAMQRINDPDLEARILADMEAEMDATIERSLTRLKSVTNSPDSSASTPVA
jgi:hypothetical protein